MIDTALMSLSGRIAAIERELERRQIEVPLPVVCHVINSGAQVLANNTVTPITFDTDVIDPYGMHSTSVNTSRVTIPTGFGGYYLVVGYLQYPVGAGVERQARLHVNGTVNRFAGIAPLVGNSTRSMFALTINLVDGDYVELNGFQDSGGNLSITVQILSVFRIRAS